MRPVRMDKMGLLAAALYAVLSERKTTARVVGFKVCLEVMPGVTDNQFGHVIGNVQVDYDQKDIREFTIRFVEVDLVCEIKQDILTPKHNDQYNGAYLNVEHLSDIEIDFDKRTVRNRRVCTFRADQMNWNDFVSLKGLALDIIGMILSEQNSI